MSLASQSVTNKYAEQLKVDVEWRKELAEKQVPAFHFRRSIWATRATAPRNLEAAKAAQRIEGLKLNGAPKGTILELLWMNS
jgi:hypothetical protein